MDDYITEALCTEAGFEWEPALCIGLILTLSENNDTATEEEDAPPECVLDCPDFDLIEDGCDGEDCDTADADCAIIASWADNGCISDCTGDDADEVNMFIGACTDCIANETDCEEAFDDND